VSSQLLTKLEQAVNSDVFNDHPGLLLWLIYMGGAFLPVGPTRSSYIALLSWNSSPRFEGLYNSWAEVFENLQRFIWSEKAFTQHTNKFWEATPL
jgi:hypothetical protein